MVESLESSTSQIFDLRSGVFTAVELEVVTKVASYLEKHGNPISRSLAKDSFRICMRCMRSAYEDTGWWLVSAVHFEVALYDRPTSGNTNIIGATPFGTEFGASKQASN